MTREEYLNKVKETQVSAREEVLKPKNNWKSDDHEYTALNAGGYKLLRLIAPVAFRPFNELEAPNHPVAFEQAFCMNDDGKKVPIIGAPKYPNVLKDMYFKANKPSGKNAAGKNIYKLEEADPELFLQITKNNVTNSEMEKGWKFTPLFGCNAIDREDMDWHRQMKQTKLLAKSMSQNEDTTNYSDGLPISWHGYAKDANATVDPEEVVQDFSYIKMVEEHGMPLYDVVVWKKKYMKVADPKAIWYKSWRAKDHINNIDKNLTLDWCTDFLEEIVPECDYELRTYNTQKKYRPTPAVRIKAMYANTIQRFDDVMGTSLMKKLEEQILKEEKDPLFAEAATFTTYDGTPIEGESTPVVEKKETPVAAKEDYSDVPFEEKKQEEPVAPASSRRAIPATAKKVTKDDLKAIGLEHADMLTDSELDMIEAIKDGQLVYKAGNKTESCPDEKCGFVSPIEPVAWSSCPKCGVKYQ